MAEAHRQLTSCAPRHHHRLVSGRLICIVPLVFTLDLLVDVVSLALGYFFIECADSSIWMLGMDVLPEHLR